MEAVDGGLLVSERFIFTIEGSKAREQGRWRMEVVGLESIDTN